MEEKIDFLDKTPTPDTIQDFLYKLDMKPHMHTYWVVSSTFQIVQILDDSNFDLVSSLLALFAARKVAQMTSEMIECYHLR